MKKLYAGVGPRETPVPICERMTRIAVNLNARGWRLRSGGARGADKAFEAGANPMTKEILRPKHVTPEALEIARKYHPIFDELDEGVQALMGRNVQIYLGLNLDDPVDCVVVWTPNRYAGGTGMGLRLADDRGIPVFNLNDEDFTETFPRFLRSE